MITAMTNHFVEVHKKVLSPAAQAVLDAFLNGYICNSADNSVAFQADRNGLAAAIRVLADCAPTPHQHEEDAYHSGFYAAINYVRTIATNLEAQP